MVGIGAFLGGFAALRELFKQSLSAGLSRDGVYLQIVTRNT